MTTRSITVRAYAKINLSLHVDPVRPDGFHGVRTILQSIDVFDRLTCKSRRGAFEIDCSVPGVPTDRTNLVWRAAQHLWTTSGRGGTVRDTLVTIDKKIPMQAGLGGGSSDAAAALFALRRLWNVMVSDERLELIAAELGSDVPFFFVGGTALGLGRGEEIYPLEDLARLSVVLVLPPFGVTTKDAYRWFDESSPPPSAPAGFLPGTWLAARPLSNMLEPPVAKRHPAIADYARRLKDAGAMMAAMSGSGSTVFGVFASPRAASAAVRHLSKPLKKEGARIVSTRFLPRRRA